jgi:hypothetical protein
MTKPHFLGGNMEYKKGERVKHPKKSDWGIGQVLADSAGGAVKVFFTHAGEKAIALDVKRQRYEALERAVKSLEKSASLGGALALVRS